ncbi:MAG: hypothetical protein AB1689_17200 [Thermodesulfobacteriota bacterium]
MTAPSMSPAPTARRDLDAAEFRKHGIVAGLVGAALLAVWFLIVDVLRGHPLFTPTLLLHALLSGGDAPPPEEGSIASTLLFTAVHALAFTAIGVMVAEFLRQFDLVHSRALMLVLLFVALCVAFLAFGVLFAVLGPEGITLRDAFIGNALAAFGMAAYLGRALGDAKVD